MLRLVSSVLTAVLVCSLAVAQPPPPACPFSLQTKAGAAQVRPGRSFKLAVKIANTGWAPVHNLSIRFTLPQGSMPIRVAVQPRLKPPRQPVVTSDGNLYLTGLSINPRKARALMLKLRLDRCAPPGVLSVLVMAYRTDELGAVVCTTAVQSATVRGRGRWRGPLHGSKPGQLITSLLTAH